MADLPDPIKQASLSALSAMSESAFGSVLGPVVDSELANILGIGGSSDDEEYFDKVMQVLQKIESQLDLMQQSLATIEAGIVAIKEAIEGVNIQRLLDDFRKGATTITLNFSLYQESLKGLLSKNSATQRQASKALYQMLSFGDARTIADAMLLVQGAFVTNIAEEPGLIELQDAMLRQAITSAGSASDHWVSADPEYSVPITNRFGQVGAYNGFGLFRDLQNGATNALNHLVVDTFRTFVTVSMQGLIFLNVAWLDGPFKDEIQKQVDAIKAILAAMVAFGKPERITPIVDAQVSADLKTLGKPLTGPAVTAQYKFERMDPISFGPDWIQWQPNVAQFPPFSIPYLLRAPWDYTNDFVQLQSHPKWDFIDVSRSGWSHDPPTGPTRYNPSAPATLQAFLAPLAQLTAAKSAPA